MTNNQNNLSNFYYSVALNDSDQLLDYATSEIIVEVFQEAMRRWSQHILGVEGASLEVQINIGGTDAVASAGPADLITQGDYLDENQNGTLDAGDILVVLPGTLHELQSGEDLNGEAPDIIVNINPEYLDNFHIDPYWEQPVPEDKIDLLSVAVHELAHALGFLALAGQTPILANLPLGQEGIYEGVKFATLYDLFINDTSVLPRFTATAVEQIYGTGAPLEFNTGDPGSDISHFLANSTEDGATDLYAALMNPYVIPGDRVEIGALELALFEDIGHQIEQTDLFVNTLDWISPEDLPEVRSSGLSNFKDGMFIFDVGLSSPFPLVSSVGVGFETQAQYFSDRVLFDDSIKESVGLGLTDLFGQESVAEGEYITSEVDLILFNPIAATIDGVTPGNVGEVRETLLLGFGRGTAGADIFYGEAADVYKGGSGDDSIFGGTYSDVLFGQNGSDFISGGKGNDSLHGGQGPDILLGNQGDDLLWGGSQNDLLVGGHGFDELRGGNGADALDGGCGDDLLYGGNGDDFLYGDFGNDRIKGGNGADVFRYSDGHDIIADFEVVDTLLIHGMGDWSYESEGALWTSSASLDDSVFLQGISQESFDALTIVTV